MRLRENDSQDAMLNEMGTLITVARQFEGRIPGLKSFRAKLERGYMEALTARSTRDSLRAETQKATSRLNEKLTVGEEAARRLRSYVRGMLGPRNQQLTCFGVAPLKKRRLPRPDEMDTIAGPIAGKNQEDAA